MIRLKDAHRGQRALVVFGGPSLIAQGFDFGRLNNLGFVTFLESKALTPHLLRSGFVPDYYLMLFPEKSKDNTLQHFVFRSFLARYRIDGLLAKPFRHVAEEMRARFDECFESWWPNRPHKRLRWRPDVYLPDSPYDLLRRLPTTRVIVDRELVDEYFPNFAYAGQAYYFAKAPGEPVFDIEKYYDPLDADGMVRVRCCDAFLNSAAIALYPLLRYLGFQEVYCLGMDMSILGSLEYAALYTFRSMAHYWWFLRRNGRAFSGNYIRNGWLFDRPQNEFDALRMLWNEGPIAFTRVYDPWRWAAPVDGVRVMSVAQLLQA